MTYKFYTSLFVLLFVGSLAFAQEDSVPEITDEMTMDAEQNAQWRDGDYGYSAKPKNAWELAIHGGGFHINGDVPSGNPCMPSGIGLHLRKAISYALSWRLDLLYGTDRGLDGRETSVDVLALDNSSVDFRAYPDGGFTYRNFRNTSFGGSINLIFNLGNMLFHKPNNKWNFYAGVGLGLMSTNVEMDYFQDNGVPYDFTGVSNQFGRGVNSGDKRSAINDILDGNYESEFENDRQVPFIHDNGKVFLQGSFILGVSRKINDRINISLEHQIFAQDYDKLDGHEWRSTVDQTNDSDIIHYSNVRVAFNLGSRDNSTEPLYWLNPLDATFNDIAALKQRPILDLTDEDGDNVIDMLDQELGSEAGCAVDTRGITLDSDGDGIADCKDDEPYSPPGFEIDEKGVAMLPPPPTVLGEEDVIRIINENCPGCKRVETGCGEWFLPMIHFDLDKSNIKPEYYSQLHHVGTVLKKCPEACVTVHGHTDPRNSNDYNNALSYKRAKAAIDHLVNNYGIDRSRLKLMYGGEDSPLVTGLSSSDKNQLLNRRVEFRLCDAGDYDMPMPEGAVEASNNSGAIFSGNKNSGY